MARGLVPKGELLFAAACAGPARAGGSQGAGVVRFENVGMRYGMGPEVLRDVSFTLEPGSFHFLTGPSGAGKTSLLKLLYLAHRPSRGLITMFGEDLATLPRAELPPLRRRIGVVFQEFRLLDHLTAFDNVALPLRIAGQRRRDYAEDVAELLSWVGLGDRMDARPPTLSGGEKQRVAIARAVVAKPDLLLADEPTGNVDPEIGQRLIRLFVELNRLGATVLIATHDRSLLDVVKAPRLAIAGGRLHQDAASSGPRVTP
jgi:cell division transport system ATP-binding protein